MNFLPAWKSTPHGPVEQFVHDNEPAGMEMAIEFRKGLIAALNYIAMPGQMWSEDPDGLYAEAITASLKKEAR